MIHVLSYYTALLGFVYNTKAGKRMGAAKLEWIAVGKATDSSCSVIFRWIDR